MRGIVSSFFFKTRKSQAFDGYGAKMRNPGGVSDPALQKRRPLSLRRAAVIDLDQTYASAVVYSRKQRGVKARGKRRNYARLEIV